MPRIQSDSQYVTSMTDGLMDIMIDAGWHEQYPKMRSAIHSIVCNAEKNKEHLRHILSHHPEWSPKDEAVIFNINDMIPKLAIDDAISSYFSLVSRHIENNELRYQSNIFKYIIQNKLFDNKGQLTKESSDLLTLVGIPTVRGKKYSRTLRAWGDNIPKLKLHSSYERYYAQISDAICPTTVVRKSVISINPLHFALMSNGNSWTSCHNIKQTKGWNLRMGGTFAFAQDSTTILFYTLDQSCDEIIKCPKITRQVFHYHAGTLIQQVQYPKHCTESSAEYRRIVQSVIADSLNLARPKYLKEVANLWKTEKGCNHWTESKDSFHYPDYDRKQAGENGTTSFLNGLSSPEQPSIVDIGHHNYCLKCGKPSKSHVCDTNCKP